MGNILILVVLYEELLSKATAVEAVQHYLRTNTHDSQEIMCFDNSITGEIRKRNRLEAENQNFTYVSLNKNVGLAQAYQYAFKTAAHKGYDYLMLLDQDTAVDDNYFNAVTSEVKKATTTQIVAIVPQVAENNHIFAPVKIKPLYSTEIVNTGIHRNIVSINSGTILKVDFLQEIGGFNEKFSLDYLDHWLFYTIALKKKSIVVLNTVINQRLSVHDIKSVKNQRYISIIKSERYYVFNYRRGEIWRYYRHILLRVGKMVISGELSKAWLNVKNISGRLK